MKILHLNHSDSIGGAAKFSYRLHKSLLSIEEDSYMCCSSVRLREERIFRIHPDTSEYRGLFLAKFAQMLDLKVRNLEKTNIKTFKSASWFGAVDANWINKSDFDVVNLHWINGGLISIKEIGKIRKPIVWSMLDMWPFLGAEHYVSDHETRGITEDYRKSNRTRSDHGLDMCRISAQLKVQHLSNNISYVAPSGWLASRAEGSQRLAGTKVRVIPAALDTDLYSPAFSSSKAQQSLTPFVIGYGGGLAERKGWALFNNFLNTYNEELLGSTIVMFGSQISDTFSSPYYEIRQEGSVRDEKILVNLYRQMDVLLFPSSVEAFGLVAQEAQSCGVPVIYTKNTGTDDVVESMKSGFSINGSLEELLVTLTALKKDHNLRKRLSSSARERALTLWRQDVVAAQYLNLYQSLKGM